MNKKHRNHREEEGEARRERVLPKAMGGFSKNSFTRRQVNISTSVSSIGCGIQLGDTPHGRGYGVLESRQKRQKTDNVMFIAILVEVTLSKSFEMKDLGIANYCLGIEFSRDEENRVYLNQRNYI